MTARTREPDDDDAWRSWSPAAQEKALARLREYTDNHWKPFYCHRPEQGLTCDGKPHDDWVWPHARSDQHPPADDWLVWLVRGGRGSGKTRTGAEWVHRRTQISPRIAIVAPTGPDARDIMVEGESGLLVTAPPGKRPAWEPSKRKLTWPNGAVAQAFSGEEPDRLRGPQHHDCWIDEPAHMPLIEEVWANLQFGMRLGNHPRICATTTPVPSAWMKRLIADPDTVSIAVTTYANIDNLAPTFAKAVLARYEGTRRGRQEIHGEVLEDVEGALWSNDMIEEARVPEHALYERIVVGVDPAGTANNRSDETGIVVVGLYAGDFYVLADRSGRYSPAGWADRVMGAMEMYSGDCVVAESNYGGEMVRSTLEAASQTARIKMVNSRRGKVIRADPIVALYERGRVHHVGVLLDLENQLTSWVPGTTSPDRLDALVHGLTDLAGMHQPASIATPADYGRLRNAS